MESSTLKRLNPSELSPALKPLVISDSEGLRILGDYLRRVSVCGLDVETNMTDDFTDRRLRTIQFGDRNEQYIIDLLAFAGSKEALIAAQGFGGSAGTELIFGQVISTIREALESRRVLKVGTNLQFEYETLRFCLGIRTDGFHDLLRGEQNIHAGLVPLNFKGIDFWGLENMAERYLCLSISKDEQKTFDLESPLTDGQIIYAALDVRLPIAIMGGQLKTLNAEGLMRAAQIDFDAIPVGGDMRLHGLLTDYDKWTALITRNIQRKKLIIERLDYHFIPVVGSKFVTEQELQKLKALEDKWRDSPGKTPEQKEQRKIARCNYMELRKKLNERSKAANKCEGDAAINYGSEKQLLKAFRQMGFGVKKLPDTGDDTLEKLAEYPNLEIDKVFENYDERTSVLDYPVIDLLRLFRTVDKQLSTYGTAWITDKNHEGHRNPTTGRIHSNINLFGADTGRSSSSGPNVQNIPKTKIFRSCFVARPGYKILTIDMSGAELRIMAEMAGETVWLEAFAKGWDVHSVGAEILYGDKWKNATIAGCAYYETINGKNHQKCKCPEHSKLRDGVKAVNFGIAYGKTAHGLSNDLSITFEEAEDLLARYKAAFPTIMKWLDEVGNRAKEQLSVRSMEGGRRRWKKPDWEVAKKRANEEAAAEHKKDSKKPQFATQEHIRRKYVGMFRAIEREGKNAGVQRTNSYIAKRAMYLTWLRLEPEFGGYFMNFVHDEFVIELPEETAEAGAKFVQECFLAAGREFFKTIDMESEYHIEDFWTK